MNTSEKVAALKAAGLKDDQIVVVLEMDERDIVAKTYALTNLGHSPEVIRKILETDDTSVVTKALAEASHDFVARTSLEVATPVRLTVGPSGVVRTAHSLDMAPAAKAGGLKPTGFAHWHWLAGIAILVLVFIAGTWFADHRFVPVQTVAPTAPAVISAPVPAVAPTPTPPVVAVPTNPTATLRHCRILTRPDGQVLADLGLRDDGSCAAAKQQWAAQNRKSLI